MAELIWAPSALVDMDNIAEFIGHDSLQGANRTDKCLFRPGTNFRKISGNWQSCSVVARYTLQTNFGRSLQDHLPDN